MNLMNVLAEQYLWDYQEPFVITALRWIFNIMVYGGIALAISVGVREVVRASNNKPTSSKSPVSPVAQTTEVARAASPTASDGTATGRIGQEKTLSPADLPRAVPDASAGSADAVVNVAGSEVSERLRTLNHLRDKGLVSPEIYEAKRQQILQAL